MIGGIVNSGSSLETTGNVHQFFCFCFCLFFSLSLFFSDCYTSIHVTEPKFGEVFFGSWGAERESQETKVYDSLLLRGKVLDEQWSSFFFPRTRRRWIIVAAAAAAAAVVLEATGRIFLLVFFSLPLFLFSPSFPAWKLCSTAKLAIIKKNCAPLLYFFFQPEEEEKGSAAIAFSIVRQAQEQECFYFSFT